jgi:hypothetical protein
VAQLLGQGDGGESNVFAVPYQPDAALAKPRGISAPLSKYSAAAILMVADGRA